MAQSSTAKPATSSKQSTPASSADGKVVGVDTPAVGDAAPSTKTDPVTQSWSLLTDSVHDDKHVDVQIQALGALGTMGANPKSVALIDGAFSAKDVDTRTAAVLAAGQARSHSLEPKLRDALNAPEAQIAFAAATVLWKMGDHSGEDLLLAVVDGDRKASAPLVEGSMHQANREMHNPASLARLGAETGASLLLGPFGFGVTAYEYIRKNGGDAARVQAVEDIAQLHTPEARSTLEAALQDKDPTVRAAAVKALRGYHDEKTQHAIAQLLYDTKKPVQLGAAAAYLISAGVVAMPPPTPTDH
jgi:HEAT repeat protein